VIGSSVAFLVYRWFRPFPLRPYLDVVAPSIAVGVLFGRLGCFLNGCCFGDACNLPWAVAFPRPSPPWEMHEHFRLIAPEALWSLPVHPTQIYAAFDGLVLLLLLSAYYPLRRRDGEVMGLLMLTYPVTRILIEYLRNDEGIFFAGMTISQNISLALLLGGVIYWIWLSRLPRQILR
jgi:phosphatidylglycerol:prolipoprotein diacylglycerol transferase